MFQSRITDSSKNQLTMVGGTSAFKIAAFVSIPQRRGPGALGLGPTQARLRPRAFTAASSLLCASPVAGAREAARDGR